MIRTMYKAEAPFMEVKSGHGFYGVVMYDDQNDLVQCHVCGLWFKHVGVHSYKKHKISGDSYKIQFGLSLRTGLCSVGVSNERRISTEAAIERGEIRQDIASQSAKVGLLKERSAKRRQNGAKIAQWSNKYGLCDLQIQSRYEVVKVIVGREPSENEIIKYDRKLFHCGIVPRFQNLTNFRKHLNISTDRYPPTNKIEAIDLIASLRKQAKESGTIPKVTDFNGQHKAFYRAFGSWKQALSVAGLK